MSKITISILILLSMILFLVLCINVNFIQDDAFITFRYVENFINGNGLVFNPGEYVEGYTSFLWTILLSVFAWSNVDFVALSQYLSVGFGILILPFTFLLSKQIKINASPKFSAILFNLIPVVMIALTGGVHYWSISGMETSMFVFLILLSIYLYLRRSENRLYLIVLLLASLTRPEGIAYSVTLIALHVYRRRKQKQVTAELMGIVKSLKLEVVYYAFPLLVYFLFRLSYYGYPFPNTFYAKTGFGLFYIERGLSYFYETLSRYLYYGAMILFPLLLLKLKSIRSRVVLFYSLIGMGIAGVLAVGGDVLSLHRFLLPVLPLTYILFSKSLEYIISNLKWTNAKTILSGIVVSLVIFVSVYEYRAELPRINELRGYELGLVNKMKIYSRWVNDQIEKRDDTVTVCLSTIGAFSFNSNARVIDLIGLTDEYIAHNPKEVKGIAENVNVIWKERRYNVEYVMEQEPDYIIMPAGAKPSAYPESALFTRRKFLEGYYPQLFYSNVLGQYLPVFTKKPDIGKVIDEPISCDPDFIDHYIQAQNDFLQFLQSRDSNLISSIEKHCRYIINSCSSFESYARTVLGYTYYHSGNIDDALVELEKSVEHDEYNCLSMVYLVNIYENKSMTEETYKYIRMLKKISPDAFPGLKLKL